MALERYHAYIKGHSSRMFLIEICECAKEMEYAGVELEDVATLFHSERIADAHNSIVMAIQCESSNPAFLFRAIQLHPVLHGSSTMSIIRYLASLGLAPTDARSYCANYFCVLQQTLKEGSDIRNARIKETRFACQMASRWMHRMMTASEGQREEDYVLHQSNTIWVNHVLPFIAIYWLGDDI